MEFKKSDPELLIALRWVEKTIHEKGLSYDVASRSEITPCNKIDKH